MSSASVKSTLIKNLITYKNSCRGLVFLIIYFTSCKIFRGTYIWGDQLFYQNRGRPKYQGGPYIMGGSWTPPLERELVLITLWSVMQIWGGRDPHNFFHLLQNFSGDLYLGGQLFYPNRGRSKYQGGPYIMGEPWTPLRTM